MNLGLKDRVAIVTGSSRGIGKAIAYGLAQEGARVVLCARQKEELMQTAREIHALTQAEVYAVPTDLNQTDDIKTLIEKTIARFTRIDILVNNTGGPPPKLFIETTNGDWSQAYQSLFLSLVTCCRGVIPYMQQQKWGRIINMTSFSAKQPVDRLILSNATRAGILGFTKTLSKELARDNILVNAICPGWTLTRRIDELARSTAHTLNKAYDAVISEWADQIPLKRLARPEEIAPLAVFLASEQASYITGTVIQVDGGYIQSLL